MRNYTLSAIGGSSMVSTLSQTPPAVQQISGNVSILQLKYSMETGAIWRLGFKAISTLPGDQSK